MSKNNNLRQNLLIVLGIIVIVSIVYLGLNNLVQISKPGINLPSSYTLQGNIFGFGSNFAGQLGKNNFLKSPVELQNLGVSNVIKFETGNKHSIFLTSNGEVLQYGLNGIEGEQTQRTVEKSEGSSLDNIIDISAGSDYSIALDSNGQVWAWGNNLTGQLGKGDNTSSIYALKIEGLRDITKISAGYKFALALDKYGNVWGWGGSCSEERKKAADAWLNSPKTVPGIGGYYDPTSSSSSGNDINNQTEDYNSYCANQEVIGFSSKTPIKIEGLSAIKEISAGWGHTLAVDTKGDVWALGCNLYMQVSTTADHMKPYRIPELKNIVEVSAGYRHSLALNSLGQVYGWGYNLRGDLGIGSTSEKVDKPTLLKLKNVEHVFASHDYSATLSKNGELHLFGENNSGIISSNLSQIYTPDPIRTLPDINITEVSAGKNFVLISSSN